MPYRPTERTEARRAEVRERIAEAALAQLAEGGYASASVQAVAEWAGVATGSVYRHFPSKRDLFTEVFRRASGRELGLLREVAAGEGGPRERIAAAVEVFARRALAGPQRAWALIAEPVDPSIEAERLVFRHGYRDVFKGVLEEGIESGELPPHDSDTVAAALVGAIGEALVGPLSPAANGAGRRRHEALVASLVQFCLSAIPAAEGPRVEEENVGRRHAHV
jgi:AcrR family transcriptional regulator